MKIVNINESQKNRLFEAYSEWFSFDTLSSLGGNWEKQYEYCVKMLGEPDEFGSSRCVFTLSDNMVLKLAIGSMFKAGIAQNKQECMMFKKYNTPLLARIYGCDKNYTYLVSEMVVPAELEDFEKILGIPFYHNYYQNSKKEKNPYSQNNGDKHIGYNKYFDSIKKPNEASDVSLYDILSYIESNYSIDDDENGGYYMSEYEDVIENSEWLMSVASLACQSGMTDFCSVENFGIVNRDGKPMIVILDSGMNLDVWTKNYNN